MDSLCCSFHSSFLAGGLVNCGGVIYTALLEEFESGRGATGNYLIMQNWIKTNWIMQFESFNLDAYF